MSDKYRNGLTGRAVQCIIAGVRNGFTPEEAIDAHPSFAGVKSEAIQIFEKRHRRRLERSNGRKPAPIQATLISTDTQLHRTAGSTIIDIPDGKGGRLARLQLYNANTNGNHIAGEELARLHHIQDEQAAIVTELRQQKAELTVKLAEAMEFNGESLTARTAEINRLQFTIADLRRQNEDLVHQLAEKNEEIAALNTLARIRSIP